MRKFTLTRRQKLSLVSILCLSIFVSGFFIGTVFSQSGSAGYFSLTAGIYPGATSYTVWVDSGYYYAKDSFGYVPAWGEGSTNASYVILSASGNDRELFLSDGNYLISSVLTFDGLVNFGLSLSDGTRLYRNTVGYHLLSFINSENVRVHGGSIDGILDDIVEAPDIYNSNSIRVSNCTNVVIEKVNIVNPSDDGIYITNSTAIKVIGNDITNFYKHAIDVVGTSLAETCKNVAISANTVNGQWGNRYDGITVYCYSPEGISIVNNVVRNVYNNSLVTDQSGIHVEDPSPAPISDIITISGNVVANSKFGITSASSHAVTINGNTIKNCTRGIFLYDPADSSITANTIDYIPTSVWSNSGLGIYVNGGARNTIANNVISNTTSHGILCDNRLNYTVPAMYASSIVGNVLSYITGNGIYLNASYSLTLSGNAFKYIGYNGIFLNCSNHIIINSNIFLDYSTIAANTYDGVGVNGLIDLNSYWISLSSNDFQSTTNARYHVYFDAYSGYSTLSFNNFGLGNATSPCIGGNVTANILAYYSRGFP